MSPLSRRRAALFPAPTWSLSLPGRRDADGTFEIDPDHRLDEITRMNNLVQR
jgi:hypothetical protein